MVSALASIQNDRSATTNQLQSNDLSSILLESLNSDYFANYMVRFSMMLLSATSAPEAACTFDIIV